MSTLAERVADYAAGLRYEDLPPEVVHQAKRVWLDTLGCAVGGLEGEPSRIARDLALTTSSREPATILGTGARTSPEMAAFANGVALRYMDYNDTYTGQELGHPSDQIAPILAAGEVMGASGKDVIVATALAYELFCRSCDAVNVRGRGFDYVTLGAVSTAVAVAKVLELGPEQIHQAVNLTLTPNLALFQTRIGAVSMWKACASANVGRQAIFAALLARRGLTGPAPIFEGRGGFFVVSGAFELGSFGGRDASFKILETSLKRYPVGHLSQTIVEAAVQLRSTIDVADIAAVEIRTCQAAIEIMAGDPEKWGPRSRETADHSMPYATAVALMFGPPSWSHFGEPYLHDEALLDLVGKVRVVRSEESDRLWPGAMLATVEVTEHSGQRRSATVRYHRGHWKNPMTDSEIEEKFRSLADGPLTARTSEALLQRIWHLDEIADVTTLAGAVSTPAS